MTPEEVAQYLDLLKAHEVADAAYHKFKDSVMLKDPEKLVRKALAEALDEEGPIEEPSDDPR